MSKGFSSRSGRCGIAILDGGPLLADATELRLRSFTPDTFTPSGPRYWQEEPASAPSVPRLQAPPAVAGRSAAATRLELVRRWFFARARGSGFLLAGFPTSLDEARALDEWAEARGESLDAVLLATPSPVGSLADAARYWAARSLLESVPDADALAAALARRLAVT